MQEIISAIDVGTTKICVLTAAVTHDSLGNMALNVLGEGEVASRGMRRGVVVDVPNVTAAIGEAVELCERDSGQQVTLYTWIYETFFLPWAGALDGSLIFAMTNVLVWLAVAAFLYRRRIFIKI